MLDLNIHEIDQISAAFLPSLTPSHQDWDWLKPGQNEHFYYKLRLLRAIIHKSVLREDSSEQRILVLLVALSYHINPNLPWTSSITSEIANACLNTPEVLKFAKDVNSSFIELLKPRLLALLPDAPASLSLSNPKLSSAGYSLSKGKSAGLLNGGLRPRLGFSGINENISEEDLRQKWKHSTDITSLSMVWYLICISKNNDQLDTYWPLITSFILNVLDDHEPLFKAQGCLLLSRFLELPNLRNKQNSHVLVRSGLLGLFTISTKSCLSFIPLLTPPDQSKLLLEFAYPTLYQLLELKEGKDNNVEYGDVVTANLLTSIAHMKNSIYDEQIMAIVHFLLDQLDHIIRKHLGPGILVCFSRVNSALSQIIVDPLISGAKKGLAERCLDVQCTILSVFENLDDPSASGLIENYKYDFLGCWAVFSRTNGVSEVVLRNVSVLRNILRQIGPNAEELLDLDIEVIQKKHPGVRLR